MTEFEYTRIARYQYLVRLLVGLGWDYERALNIAQETLDAEESEDLFGNCIEEDEVDLCRLGQPSTIEVTPSHFDKLFLAGQRTNVIR